MRTISLSIIIYGFMLLPVVRSEAAGNPSILENFRCVEASVPDIFAEISRRTGVELILKGGRAWRDSLPRLTMSFDRIPAAAVVEIICHEAAMEYQASGGQIIFEQYHPERRRTPAAPPPRQGGGTSMSISSGPRYYPVGWTTPRMVVGDGSITIIGPIPKFRKINTGTSMSMRPAPPPTAAPSGQKEPPLPRPDAAMESRLRNMRLDGLRLENAPLVSVLDELRLRSRADGGGPALNIYLSHNVEGGNRLTLALGMMNYLDALRYICQATGTDLLILPWGVVIL